MRDTDQKEDEDKFNTTLKRMLKTPPTPKVPDEENKKKREPETP